MLYLCKKTEAKGVLNGILGLGELLVLGGNGEERYLFDYFTFSFHLMDSHIEEF